jgi:hypothetical protein
MSLTTDEKYWHVSITQQAHDLRCCLLLMMLQDRFADNKEQLQDILNEIVTLKQLQ